MAGINSTPIHNKQHTRMKEMAEKAHIKYENSEQQLSKLKKKKIKKKQEKIKSKMKEKLCEKSEKPT